MKQAIIFLSDKSCHWVINNFNSILSKKKNDTDVFFLYTSEKKVIPEAIKTLNHRVITSNSLHKTEDTLLSKKLAQNNFHSHLLKFYLKKPGYDYYWFIEDDVHFNGKWSHVFEAYENDTIDFIATHIKKQAELPQWLGWENIDLGDEEIPDIEKTSSFSPILRLSNRALGQIIEALKKGWEGCYEVLIPTLLYKSGFTFADMGGTGSFVVKGFENRFYTENTMSYFPSEIGNRPDSIYHPVKEQRTLDPIKFKKNCIIAAVGMNSLHREWIKGTPDFDLHLIVYDTSYEKYYKDTNFINYQKGQKFRLIYDYLKKHPEYIKTYDYFFMPDDDIRIDTENISALFTFMKEYDLQIAQPALSNSYYTYGHTLRDKFCILRYTDFVEMMLPCFSRKALQQVIHTFDANESGWGIEFHWPQLAGFISREMAVIDALDAIHTRPIQSYSLEKENEHKNYAGTQHLNYVITETGFVPAAPENFGKARQIIGDRETFCLLDQIANRIADHLIRILQTPREYPIGLNGITGISLFLATYSRVSEKRKHLDSALLITESVIEFLALLEDQMKFKDGLPGFNWYIEYFIQHNFIEGNSDEILEELCYHLNNYHSEKSTNLLENQLIDLIPHYVARMNNPDFSKNTELHKEERKRFLEILQTIDEWIKTCSLQDQDVDLKKIADCALFLCQAEKPENIPEIKSILRQVIKILSHSDSDSKSTLPHLQRNYILLLASTAISDKQLRDKTIQETIAFSKYQEDIGLGNFLNLYLLHRMYLHTEEEVFRYRTYDILRNFILTRNDSSLIFDDIINASEKSSQNSDYLIRCCLVMSSLLSDSKVEFDPCILV